ncbi:hypothetical protein [Rhodococcus xishaensis]|uniref:NfeD-like C-terminal domain-containing protein n=1 Tax=Rhodococcus xishaensis TaxID=2487364 RepID=A0A438AQV3_9NOCA|nr:hypothetical protein [Rhodococcus xishaensis]RVW01070.1 hypothetical protein EGT50_12395 [Rhodococcus xishaensis]
MITIYLACLAMGLVGIVGTLVVGEVDGDVGAGDGTGTGLPLLSVTTAATALFGLGAGGSVAALAGAHAVVAALASAACAIALVALTRGVLLPLLLRQQANSHISRQHYVGQLGTVTLAIAPGQWGEIVFTDPEGNRVRGQAISPEPDTLPVGAAVYIGEVDDKHLHVVAIPPEESSDSALRQ